MLTKRGEKGEEKFVCKKCAFICSDKWKWERHIFTRKHLNTYQYLPKKGNICNCGKEYSHKQSLINHKKICTNIENVTINNSSQVQEKDLILKLIQQNEEFKSLIVEQNAKIIDICKNTNVTNINNNNNINNISNKTFNLNIFLNEECKDAMNIMDFVNSLKLQLCDLENVGKLGYVDGISNIIIKNLKELEINKRPMHCSDLKREIMYIKDDNKWEKENSEKDKLRKAIKYIAHKNTKLLPEFKDKYPDCVYSDSKKSDQYNTLIIESMGGKGDNDLEKENKIIKTIAKEVIINK